MPAAALPTDTFYGLAADPRSPEAVRRYYERQPQRFHPLVARTGHLDQRKLALLATLEIA